MKSTLIFLALLIATAPVQAHSRATMRGLRAGCGFSLSQKFHGSGRLARAFARTKRCTARAEALHRQIHQER